jgi:hypothetical protein
MRWLVIGIWLFISVAWFAVNAYLLENFDFSFWFVAGLPFWIGLLFLIGARLVGAWKEPPSHMHY